MLQDEKSRDNRFWKFQAIFWLVAGIALFLSGTSQTTILIAFVRNVYLTIAGFMSGFFLSHMLDRWKVRGAVFQLGVALVLAYALGVLIVVVINPVSYGMQGTALGDITGSMWFAGTLNFALVLLVWCILYLFFFQTMLLQTRAPKGETSLAVEKGREKRTIPARKILCLKAAGDYVEVYTADEDFLKRGTLSSVTQALNKNGFDFLQVHRSAVVNMDHVTGMEGRSKGSCDLILTNGRRITSGRTYQADIAARFADGI